MLPVTLCRHHDAVPQMLYLLFGTAKWLNLLLFLVPFGGQMRGLRGTATVKFLYQNTQAQDIPDVFLAEAVQIVQRDFGRMRAGGRRPVPTRQPEMNRSGAAPAPAYRSASL